MLKKEKQKIVRIDEFSKAAAYKIMYKKIILVLYTSNALFEKEVWKKIYLL